MNDLEPEKNWRDILDINSPKLSRQREFVFSKTATLSENNNNNTISSISVKQKKNLTPELKYQIY